MIEDKHLRTVTRNYSIWKTEKIDWKKKLKELQRPVEQQNSYTAWVTGVPEGEKKEWGAEKNIWRNSDWKTETYQFTELNEAQIKGIHTKTIS